MTENNLRLCRCTHASVHAELPVGGQDMDACHSVAERRARGAQFAPAAVQLRLWLGVHHHAVVGHAERGFLDVEPQADDIVHDAERVVLDGRVHGARLAAVVQCAALRARDVPAAVPLLDGAGGRAAAAPARADVLGRDRAAALCAGRAPVACLPVDMPAGARARRVDHRHAVPAGGARGARHGGALDRQGVR